MKNIALLFISISAFAFQSTRKPTKTGKKSNKRLWIMSKAFTKSIRRKSNEAFTLIWSSADFIKKMKPRIRRTR